MRTRYYVILPLVALLLLLAACGGGAPAAPAEEAAAPAQEEAKPTEAAAEEAPAAEAAPAAEGAYGPIPDGAIPFPAPPELDMGGTTVEPVAIDQIMTYKALDAYQEPEWVTKLVEA